MIHIPSAFGDELRFQGLALSVQPSLVNRAARCGCGSTKRSSETLRGFRFQGFGSEHARAHCANCHRDAARHMLISGVLVCPDHQIFAPIGAQAEDAYDCGHPPREVDYV